MLVCHNRVPATVVPVARQEVEKQRIHVRLAAALVADLDRFAQSRGITRSDAIAALLPPSFGQQQEDPSGEVQ